MKPGVSPSDIGYIRTLVRRSDRRPTPASIYLLWAVIVLAGFALVDVAPGYTGFYWMIAAPLGGAASGLLAQRYGLRRGQLNREIGMRHALHWSGMLVFVGLAVPLAVTGRIPGPELGRVILLIVAFGWWTAGVHFDRVFLWLGGLMALGYIATFLLAKFAWTALGVVLAVSLAIVALRRGRMDEAQAN